MFSLAKVARQIWSNLVNCWCGISLNCEMFLWIPFRWRSFFCWCRISLNCEMFLWIPFRWRCFLSLHDAWAQNFSSKSHITHIHVCLFFQMLLLTSPQIHHVGCIIISIALGRSSLGSSILNWLQFRRECDLIQTIGACYQLFFWSRQGAYDCVSFGVNRIEWFPAHGGTA